MSFALARKIADAVLYEGYMLYPYRPSSRKNRYRWQFGLLAPRAWAEARGDHWDIQTECLIERAGDARPELKIVVRFLEVRADVNGQWDDAVERSIEIDAERLSDDPREIFFDASGGAVRGRIEWTSFSVDRYVRCRVRVENLTEFPGADAAERNEAMRLSLAGVHTMLSVRGGAFVSLTDPPSECAALARCCENVRTWPVLVGKEGERNLLLSSPIILPDYPAVAPESQGDLFDATEIDEILTLRVMTLTDEEKAEARASDARARNIIERCDTIPPEMFERLHGAVRSMGTKETERFFNPEGYEPERESIEVGDTRVSRGGRVRLTPKRNADSMDQFLAGRIARVEGVHRDVEDRVYVAVTVEDDPAAELHREFKRFFYFYPDELEAL